MWNQLRSFLAGGDAAAPASPRELFAVEVEQFLRSMPYVDDVRRLADPYGFEVMTPDGSRRVFLDNCFAETREMSPEDRRSKIAHFFSFAVEAPQDDGWASAQDLLVPVLRGATYALELSFEEARATIVRRPFLPYVDVVVVIDRPTSMSFVTLGSLEKWKIGEAAVFDAAAARLPLLADPRLELYDDTHGPLWIVASNDSYESARLLVPGWLASLRGRVEGRPVAIIPERGTLMIGGDARPEMVERLIDKAEREFGASNRRLSPALYTVDDARSVVPYAPATPGALARRVKVAHERLALYEHGQQKADLDAAHERKGVDVYVASYDVFDGDDGSPRSLCVWSRGVRSYLPRTEVVVLTVVDEADPTRPRIAAEVPWETLQDRLRPVPGLHPPLYASDAFPTDEELERMPGHRLA